MMHGIFHRAFMLLFLSSGLALGDEAASARKYPTEGGASSLQRGNSQDGSAEVTRQLQTFETPQDVQAFAQTHRRLLVNTLYRRHTSSGPKYRASELNFKERRIE
jgi:hypothetical protein